MKRVLRPSLGCGENQTQGQVGKVPPISRVPKNVFLPYNENKVALKKQTFFNFYIQFHG